MIDKYLITKEDILYFRPTAVLDDSAIKPYIKEAQITDLKPVLNDALFLDFIQKFDQTGDSMYTKYRELLTGKSYTYRGKLIYFEGVKPMLVYYALSRFVLNNPVQVTRYGVVHKSNAQSENVDPQTLRMFINELKSVAMTYQNNVIQFLEQNSSDYPLYNYNYSNDAATVTSFNFFKG
jgi:hypothetical protein